MKCRFLQMRDNAFAQTVICTPQHLPKQMLGEVNESRTIISLPRIFSSHKSISTQIHI
jgi:hypothetical protein